ncbi:MAG: hypothetical protein QXX68_00880 [Candidatus Pacearchaeota archaeon]
MAESRGKQWLFTIVGFLFIISLFGGAIAQKGTIFGKDVSWIGEASKAVGEYIFGFGIKDGEKISVFGGIEFTTYAFTTIFLMIWLIIFVTFGDIIETFSTFNSTIAWIIAFCLAVIGGMSGAYGKLVGKVTHLFVSFGAAAVYLGLAASFIIFLLVELGLGAFLPKFKEFVLRRKLMQEEIGIRGKLLEAGAAAKALAEMGADLSKGVH